MPRAFLIKKKGRADVPVDGELNNNTDLCLENKENVDGSVVVLRKDGEERDCELRRRMKEGGKKMEEVEEEEEEEEEEERSEDSLSSEESSSALIRGRDSYIPVPGYTLADQDSVQQFPTDLSLKTSTSSAPAGHSSSISCTPQRPEPSPSLIHSLHSVAQPCSPLSLLHTGLEASKDPNWKPRKRPSDFSTAFLLSHHSGPKRTVSPVSPVQQPPRSSAPMSPTLLKLENEDKFFRNTYAKDLAIPSPSKLATSCLSMSAFLEHQRTSPLLTSVYQMSRSREDRVSTSSSLDPVSPSCESERSFPSPLGLRRDDGPSAFRRNDSKISRELSWRRTNPEDVKTSSPHTVLVDRAHDVSPLQRRGVSASPRDSVFVSPHELSGLPHARLASLGDTRRGSSTSPAHSERTSSGCGSPSDLSEGSPPSQLPRYQGDLPWGQTAPSFLQSGIAAQSHHSLAHMGLRYLPGMALSHLSKPQSDLPLSFPYPKTLSESLDSAFRSPRPPFVHPATAAYYSSLRSSLPYPLPFSGMESADKGSPRDDASQQGPERLEVLRALRTGPFDPLSAFQTSPHSMQPSHTSSHAGHVLSPRLSPRASSLPEGVTVRSVELNDLPRGLSVPAMGGMGIDNRNMKVRPKEHEPVRYQCEACSKSYSTFSGLSKHKQFHCSAQVKKEFSCKHCDKTYVSLGALKMHIRTHTLPCKCTVCGKAFSRPWLLQGHLRTHTGEKPFSCPHCARAFADRSNLRAHLQTHSEVKKYSCRHCAKTFSRMSLLQKHEGGCCVKTT